MNAAGLKETERILKAVANARRITIVRLLKQHDVLNVGELAEKLKLSFKATSRHLSVLRAANIVESQQVSLMMNYRLVRPLHSVVQYIVK